MHSSFQLLHSNSFDILLMMESLFSMFLKQKNHAFIGIGSNAGDAVDNCVKGVNEIGKIIGNRIIAISSFYKTEPISYIEQDWFVNCVVKIETKLTPRSLLTALKELEDMFGRKRGVRWGPRIIDLDVLLFDNLIIDEDELKIPHPRMHERRFVLEPLSEIDDKLVHPVIGKSVKELLKDIGFGQRVELMESGILNPDLCGIG